MRLVSFERIPSRGIWRLLLVSSNEPPMEPSARLFTPILSSSSRQMAASKDISPVFLSTPLQVQRNGPQKVRSHISVNAPRYRHLTG